MESNTFNHLKFLALKLLKTPNEEANSLQDANSNERYAWSMRKILHVDELYKFYSGFEIEGDKIIVKSNVQQDLYRITYDNDDKLEINISAIVGQNGSGKSTIIDYIIRILNNLSVCILGEKIRNTDTEHLHYVPCVYAELYILIENNIFRIRCEGERTSVVQYNLVNGSNEFCPSVQVVLNKTVSLKEPEVEDFTLTNFLKHFCYTIFVNYSMYAFDPINYIREATPFQKENLIRSMGANEGYSENTIHKAREERNNDENRDAVAEARSWLTGLFHKTDGYQVPLFISPKRTNGRIDERNEYKLAKERLMSLILKTDVDGNHLFSKINGKLEIVRFRLASDDKEKQDYSKAIRPKFLRNIDNVSYATYYKFIKKYLINEFQITEKRNHEELVWNYVIEKFFKIIVTYPDYQGTEKTFKKCFTFIDSESKDNISEMLLKILQDHSHITRKFFRCLYYLKYDLIGNKRSFSVNEYTNKALNIINSKKSDFSYPPHDIDELVPPPIYDIDFILYDENDKSREHAIQFSTLSSGEKQLTFMLCSVFYHLSNIDSVGENARKAGDGEIHFERNGIINTTIPKIEYYHVAVVFDEVELYYHPDMQRKFVYQLLNGIKQLHLKNIRSLQFIIVTHSPFILSDIPKDNVLFLKKNGHAANVDDMKTFGANIYSILKHSFFLENGAIGEFAQSVIDDIINRINFFGLWKEPNSDTLDRRIYNSLPSRYQKLLQNKQLSNNSITKIVEVGLMESLTSLIQEPVTHDYLIRKLSDIKKDLNYVAFED